MQITDPSLAGLSALPVAKNHKFLIIPLLVIVVRQQLIALASPTSMVDSGL